MQLHEYTAKYRELFMSQMQKLRQMEREFTAMYNSCSNNATECEKQDAEKLLAEMKVCQMPQLYDNLCMSLTRGLEKVERIGMNTTIGFTPNGKKSCRIDLWGGMEEYEGDPKKMETKSYA